jgi:hypothetical protein
MENHGECRPARIDFFFGRKKKNIVECHMLDSRASSGNRCRYCKKQFETSAVVTRHVAHSKACRQQWERELQRPPAYAARRHQSGGNERQESDLDEGNLEIRGAEDLEDGDTEMDHDFGYVLQGMRTPEVELEVNVAELVKQRVELEEGEEEDDPKDSAYAHDRWSETYPGQVAEAYGTAKTTFQTQHERQLAIGASDWFPFENEDEWEITQWLLKHVGQSAIDEYFFG